MKLHDSLIFKLLKYFKAEWDVGSLHEENRRRLAKSAGSCIGFMPDDSKGQKEIFRIEDFEMVPLDEAKYGMFFGGDSYVIKYTYEKDGGTPEYIIYFWQGSQSSQVMNKYIHTCCYVSFYSRNYFKPSIDLQSSQGLHSFDNEIQVNFVKF